MANPSESNKEVDCNPPLANHLGTILCKTCGELIDTFDAVKVTFYYGLCASDDCKKA
jgi:hypothetical protein